MAAQPAQPLGERGALRGDRTALSGGDGLDGMEREHGQVAVGAGADRDRGAVDVALDRADRVTGVLDDGEAVGARQLGDRGHVRALPGEVHREDDPRFQAPALRLGDRRGEMGGFHEAALGIDVGEHHLGAAEARGIGGGDEGDGGHDHGLAGLQLEREAGQVQRRGAVGAADGVRGARALRERRLEAADGGTGGEPVAAQNRAHRLDVVLVDGVTAVRQDRRRRGGHAPASWSRRMRRASSSQSSLVSLAKRKPSRTVAAPRAR